MRIGWVMATRRAVRFLGALIIAVGLGWPVIAQAQGKVRIAQQFGLSYLPLHVALELNSRMAGIFCA